jgi:hemin uptake protein HemP
METASGMKMAVAGTEARTGWRLRGECGSSSAGPNARLAVALVAAADVRQPVEAREALPSHDARALTDGGNVATILLDEQTYTLRITRAGKLILTK